MHKNIYLQRSRVDAVIRDVAIEEVGKVFKIHDVIYSYLKPEEKSYIVPKTKEQLTDFIVKPENTLLGVFINNGRDLVATTAACCPTYTNDDTYLDAFCPYQLTQSAIMLGSKVDPEYRGNGLQKTMTSIREDLVKSSGRQAFFSEIEATNYHSWVNLLKSGYSIVGRAEIIENNRLVPLYVAEKNLNNSSVPVEGEQTQMRLTEFIQQEKALFEKGITAISYNENNQSLNLGRVKQSGVYDITKRPKGAAYGL
ncbi:MAG: hypothetical protein AAF849_00720 [Bacteroidota bacterium]